MHVEDFIPYAIWFHGLCRWLSHCPLRPTRNYATARYFPINRCTSSLMSKLRHPSARRGRCLAQKNRSPRARARPAISASRRWSVSAARTFRRSGSLTGPKAGRTTPRPRTPSASARPYNRICTTPMTSVPTSASTRWTPAKNRQGLGFDVYVVTHVDIIRPSSSHHASARSTRPARAATNWLSDWSKASRSHPGNMRFDVITHRTARTT